MTIQLPDLPYPYDALEPHISAETMRYHHDKHHAKYVKKTNKLADDAGLADADLETLVLESEGELLQNAAQAWNHAFFWRSLTPDADARPDGELSAAIDQAFGDFESFRELFTERAKGHFGSGWAWLVRESDGRLAVLTTHDAGNPLRDGKQPLLVLDLWEHAYYLDRQNDRGAYIEHFWKLVDWQSVARRFAAAKQDRKARSQPRTHGAGPKIPTGTKVVSGLASALLVFGALALPGCDDDAGDDVDDAMDNIEEGAEELGDEAEDAAEDAADETEDAIDDIK